MAEIDNKLVERLAKALESLEGDNKSRSKKRATRQKEEDKTSETKKDREKKRLDAKDDKEHLENLKKEVELNTKIDKIYERRHHKKQLAAEIEKTQIKIEMEALQEREERYGRLSRADKERLDTLKEENKLVTERLDKLYDTNDAIEDMVDLGESFGEAFKIKESVEAVEGLKAGFTAVQGAIQGGTNGILAFADAFGGSLIVTFINNMVGLAVAAVDVENSFMKATGANAEMARSITETYEKTRLYTASLEDVAAAQEALFRTTTDFTMMNKEQQLALAETGTILGKLGVSNDDFANSIQISTKMLGQSATQAAGTSRELVAFAKDIGVAPDRLASQFAAAGGTMAKFGKDGVKAFKDLSMMSKVTGMSLDKILNITNKFDTFEGAADQAGKLNAALGGNFVNAMDLMMETDPAARFEMIRDSIKDAGLSFDDMSYYQKNFYKDSLGLADVGELAMLMSGDINTLTGDLGKNSDELVAMKENAAAVASLQEQWTALIADFTPILTSLMDVMRSFVGWLREYSGVLKFIVSLFVAYKAGVYAMIAADKAKVAMDALKVWWTSRNVEANNALADSENKVSKASAGSSMKMKIFLMVIRALAFYLFQKQFASNFVEGIGKMGEAFKFVGEALDSILEPLSNNVKGLLAFGAAILMAGAGIAIAATGVADLARAFGEVGENAWPAVAAIVALGLTIVGLGYLITTFAVSTGGVGIAAVLAMGAAFLMLGAGVALAATGVATFVKSAKDVDLASMGALTLGLYALAGALTVLGNPLAAAGAYVMIAVSAGLLLLSVAAEKLPFVTDMVKMLGTVIEAVTAPLRVMESVFETLTDPQRVADLAVGFVEIAAAIDKIPTTKTMALTQTLMATTVAANTVAAVGGGKAMAQGVVGAMGPATAPAASAGNEKPYKVTINLQMGDEIIKTEVLDIVGGIAKRAIGLL